jgi:hypothetical protein
VLEVEGERGCAVLVQIVVAFISLMPIRDVVVIYPP